MPGIHNLFNDLPQRTGDGPSRVLSFHFSEVAVVANVVAYPILIEVRITLRLAGEFLDYCESFQDGTGIIFSAAVIVEFGEPG
jgi:hypothetical protein